MTKAGTVQAGRPGSTNERRMKEGREKGESTRERAKVTIICLCVSAHERWRKAKLLVLVWNCEVYLRTLCPRKLGGKKTTFPVPFLETLCRGCWVFRLANTGNLLTSWAKTTEPMSTTQTLESLRKIQCLAYLVRRAPLCPLPLPHL